MCMYENVYIVYKIFVAVSYQTGLDTRSITPKVGLKWGLGEGKVGHESRFERCWTLLVIDPLNAM